MKDFVAFVEHYKEDINIGRLDKLLVDYIIGDLEFDGYIVYLFYHVLECIQAYNMQNCYHIACVTYQQPLTSQKGKIYSATSLETTI